MPEVKLTRQSEEILRQLKADMTSGRLTEDQVKFVVKCMELKASVGILANVIVKAAALGGESGGAAFMMGYIRRIILYAKQSDAALPGLSTV